jgi:hypothetical protein
MRAERWRLTSLAALALAAALPATGSARAPEGSDTDGDLLTKLGEYFLVGGGVAGFTERSLDDQFDVGGTWDARLGVGSRFYVGGEVAYVGSAMDADGPGSDLLANGVEGVLRLQYPYLAGRWLVEPFAFGGVGYSRLSLRDEPPGVEKSDGVGVVPFGGGVTLGYEGVLLDVRFTYRTHFSEDLALRAGERAANLESWAAGASVGYEF